MVKMVADILDVWRPGFAPDIGAIADAVYLAEDRSVPWTTRCVLMREAHPSWHGAAMEDVRMIVEGLRLQAMGA